MTTSIASRIKFWLGIGAVAIVILGLAAVWPGNDDDAIDRFNQESERRKEAVVKADFTTDEGYERFIRWGRTGALTQDDNPSAPFERVVEVQSGDRVSILVQTKKFDSRLACSVTVNGQTYTGDVFSYGCEAKANVH